MPGWATIVPPAIMAKTPKRNNVEPQDPATHAKATRVSPERNKNTPNHHAHRHSGIVGQEHGEQTKNDEAQPAVADGLTGSLNQRRRTRPSSRRMRRRPIRLHRSRRARENLVRSLTSR